MMLLATVLSNAGAQTVLTVNSAGPGPSAPWNTAYSSLQSALADAATLGASEIWVATGTYRPSATDPAASFVLPPGVKIRGGFAGTETTPEARSSDRAANATILAGLPPGFEGTKVVVKVTNSTPGSLIDRVTISGGRGVPSTPLVGTDLGASGVHIVGGILELADCTIANNFGNYSRSNAFYFAFASAPGGGLAIDRANVTLRGCRVIGNAASSGSSGTCVTGSLSNARNPGGDGGGLFVRNSTLRMEDCEILNNTSGNGSNGLGCSSGAYSSGARGGWGAGLSAQNSSLTLLRCVFSGNRAGRGGEGGTRQFSSAPVGGTGESGGSGGALAVSGGNIFIESSKFLDNTSGNAGAGPAGGGLGGYGGGAYISGVQSATLVQCVFAGNRSGSSASTVSVFAPCGAPGRPPGLGAGLAVFGATELRVSASTFVSNRSGNPGSPAMPAQGCTGDPACCGTPATGGPGVGGLIYSAVGTPDISGCILWDNGVEIHENAQIAYSCVQAGALGVGNVAADPMFVNAITGDYRLQAGSPAINAGSNSRFRAIAPDVVLDAAGRPRFAADPSTPNTGEGLGPIIDMGAFERSGCEADVTGDGQLTPADLLEFLARWFAGDPRTNVNGSGEIDVADLFGFMNMWFMGC